MVGIYLNRARAILTVVYIPLALLAMFSESILLALGMGEDVAHYAGTYARIAAPGFWAYSQFQAVRRYLAC